MYSRNGVVYKLHAGWFINRTPGEFINRGPFIKFKGFLCGNPTERGESLILNFLAGRQFISPTQAPWLSTASEGLQNRKKYNTSNICTVNISMWGADIHGPNVQTSTNSGRRKNRTVSNALADTTLVFWIFCSMLFSMVGAPANKKSTFAKAASIPRWQSENAGPRVFGFIFGRCPPSRIFFQFFELSTKAAFAKAAFGTLQKKTSGRKTSAWFLFTTNFKKLATKNQPQSSRPKIQNSITKNFWDCFWNSLEPQISRFAAWRVEGKGK